MTDATHTRSMWIALASVAALLVVLTAVGLYAANAVAESWPCAPCHVPLDSQRGDAAHATLGCYECHAPSTMEAAFSFWGSVPAMAAPAVFSDGVPGPPIGDSACTDCHEIEQIPVDGGGSIRFDHVACQALEVGCSACHVFEHSEFTPQGFPMEDCVACHNSALAPTECDTCHAPRKTEERLDSGPWQVTHGPDWESTHGAGTLSWCSTCHPQDYCTPCHGIELPHPVDFGRTHGALALEEPAGCTACHERSTFCDPCHGVDMPHPVGFLAGHSRIADSREDERCTSCHTPRDCESCHLRHTHPGSTGGSLGDRLGGPS